MNNLKQILTPESIVNNSNNNDTYCLRWTRHPNMLSEALLENEREVVLSQTSRHEDESFLDVLIHLDDGSTVKMHSLVLAASSELFQSIGQKFTLAVSGTYNILLPDTRREEVMTMVRWLYTGSITVPVDKMPAIMELATTLGLNNLLQTVSKSVKAEEQSELDQKMIIVSEQERKVEQQKVLSAMSPTYLKRRSSSPIHCNSPSREPSPPIQNFGKRQSLENINNMAANKKLKLETLPMLQSILTQFPLNPSFIHSFAGNLANKEKDSWSDNSITGVDVGYTAPGTDGNSIEALGKLQSINEAKPGLLGPMESSQNQLANILTAAAKLKQVAEQAIKSDNAEIKGDGVGQPGSRKLAFHEPRPCPVCKRMYRDAATLRTHTAIMHSEGTEPFRCSCGIAFSTKFEMYQHKKAGHPPVK